MSCVTLGTLLDLSVHHFLFSPLYNKTSHSVYLKVAGEDKREDNAGQELSIADSCLDRGQLLSLAEASHPV